MKEKKEKKIKPQNKKYEDLSVDEQKLVRSKILRFFLIILGFISFALGCIGIALPILPTTPFFLLTAFCFVRSSIRFNRWFLNSWFYHKYLENFAETKSMILRNELILLLSVSAILMIVIYFTNNYVVSIILPIVIALKYFYFVFFVKPITKNEYDTLQKEREIKKALLKEEKEKAKLLLKEENKEIEAKENA